MPTVLLFCGRSLYRAHEVFTEQIGYGFLQQGWKAYLFCASEEESLALPSNGTGFDLVLSFNGAASVIQWEEGYLFDRLGIPQVALFTDSPLHCWDLLRKEIPSCYPFCIDRSHCSLAERISPSERPFGFLPHGAVVHRGAPILSQRKFDIFLPGTYRKPGSYLHRVNEEGRLLGASLAAPLQVAQDDPGFEPYFWLEKALDQTIDPKDPRYIRLGQAVDLYVRSYRREQLVHQLLDRGFSVTVMGIGWEAAPYASLLQILPPRSFEGVLEAMSHAALVLDSTILSQYGCHERSLTAMAAGAVAIAERNAYYDHHFDVAKEMLLYDWPCKEVLFLRIQELLEDEPLRFAIAEQGRQHVLARHTWSHRVPLLLDHLTSVGCDLPRL